MFIKLRRSIYIFLGIISNFIYARNKKIFVLCYHSIDSTNWSHGVSKRNFESQMKYLSTIADFWNLYDLLNFTEQKQKLDRNKVIITFDDGYKNISQVLDITDKYMVKPTVFVISDADSRNYSELENHKRLLSDADVNKLVQHGWTVGSHTATHPNLKTLDLHRLRSEIKYSKKSIENRFKNSCDFIAYPKGKYTDNVINIAVEAGYKMGLTMDDGFIYSDINKFKIPRIGVNRTHTKTEFKYLPSIFNITTRKLIKHFIYE